MGLRRYRAIGERTGRQPGVGCAVTPMFPSQVTEGVQVPRKEQERRMRVIAGGDRVVSSLGRDDGICCPLPQHGAGLLAVILCQLV